MKLFNLSTGNGEYFVIAKDFNEAEYKLSEIFKKADYGFDKDRKVKSISVMAEAIDDPTFLSGKFLVL